MLHGGWKKHKALMANFLSALTIVPGGLLAYFVARNLDTTFLLPFAAGNFIYIAASDLIPEIKAGKNLKKGLMHFVAFVVGILLILSIRFIFKD